jgi:phage terminase large subunit-like protein
LIDFHRKFLWRAYELNPDGSRKYRRALLGLPKGNAKTELAAAIGVCELAGPVTCGGWNGDHPIAQPRVSPDIPVAAASFEQANTLFQAARTMIDQGPLAPLFECYETRIHPKDGSGKLYRVAAEAGTNDGRRPSCFIADEVHEWAGRKERVHQVLSNGRAKRADSWELNISTAGWNMESLLGRLYKHGKRIERGEIEDPTFLFVWLEASEHLDPSDDEQLREGILECSPGVGHFLELEDVAQRFREMPEHDGRRYFWNQWADAPEQWLPPGMWDSCQDPERVVPEGEEIVIGFDGSYAGDSTAIVGATTEEPHHLFVIGAWEKPEESDSKWRVDILDVEEKIREACQFWSVLSVACDPFRWQRSIAVLEEEGLPMIEWPSHTPGRMVPACAQFYDGLAGKRITQDGDARMAKHVAQCIVKIDSRGPRITKEHKSSKKIDLAVAAVIAHDMAIRHQEPQESVYAKAETAVL